jgi:hypothetical protein
MSIEAFIMNYRNGDVCPLPFDTVRAIFDTPGTTWNTDQNYLNVRFTNPDDYVDIFCGCDAASIGTVKGLTIARPIRHTDFMNRMFQLLQLDNVMMFYSDETTPVFHPTSDPSQYPDELLDALGTPRYASTPDDLTHQT